MCPFCRHDYQSPNYGPAKIAAPIFCTGWSHMSLSCMLRQHVRGKLSCPCQQSKQQSCKWSAGMAMVEVIAEQGLTSTAEFRSCCKNRSWTSLVSAAEPSSVHRWQGTSAVPSDPPKVPTTAPDQIQLRPNATCLTFLRRSGEGGAETALLVHRATQFAGLGVSGLTLGRRTERRGAVFGRSPSLQMCTRVSFRNQPWQGR